jgi:hypothetical protein
MSSKPSYSFSGNLSDQTEPVSPKAEASPHATNREVDAMPRIELQCDPYELELYCPFCGTNVVSSEGEGVVESCSHCVCLGLDDDSEEDILDTDITFVAFEPAPACQEHIFAFREPLDTH